MPVVGDRFELRDIRVDGDDGPILDGFSARIPAVGLTAIVGESGTGKTTLLRLLNRLDDPDAGVVLLDGRDVRDYDVLELRRRVQVVSQTPVGFPGTIARNLGDAHVTALLARVGLDADMAEREADRLSLGETQRVTLARAIAREPEVLVLDEPTSALDVRAKARIECLLGELADDGMTVVLVSHDPRHAEQLADHVIELG
ncbi:MAG: ATP-binding cassette domain-containing protein [Actinobacteria bacterium]|nr:ATP-binding cassette domain-containing protein [Actinomycetota bacterium]